MPVKKGKPEGKQKSVEIVRVMHSIVSFCVLGRTPILLNRLSQKARMMLLLPPAKKRGVGMQTTLKHNPPVEYRDSVYKTRDSDDEPTRLLLPATSFKSALRDVALDTEGVTKSQIGRLTYVAGQYSYGSYIHLYGIPQLHMAPVIQAGFTGAPDIRTRAIVAEWACIVDVHYTVPVLRESVVSTLFANAGIMRGIGDYRPEKGAGSFGQYVVVPPNDKKFKAIMKLGTEVQDEALANPVPFDTDTEDLLTWFHTERVSRGFDEDGIPIRTSGNGEAKSVSEQEGAST